MKKVIIFLSGLIVCVILWWAKSENNEKKNIQATLEYILEEDGKKPYSYYRRYPEKRKKIFKKINTEDILLIEDIIKIVRNDITRINNLFLQEIEEKKEEEKHRKNFIEKNSNQKIVRIERIYEGNDKVDNETTEYAEVIVIFYKINKNKMCGYATHYVLPDGEIIGFEGRTKFDF